jgi:hypothetical protein
LLAQSTAAVQLDQVSPILYTEHMAFVQLRDQDISEFIEMYEQEVGIRLSPEDAAATARRFVTLYLGLTGQL